jgi:hypothetical protein
MQGVGGDWTGYYHAFSFGLLNVLWQPPVWESIQRELCFLDHLDTTYSLLGMDVVSQWQELKIIPNSRGDGGCIHITV